MRWLRIAVFVIVGGLLMVGSATAFASADHDADKSPASGGGAKDHDPGDRGPGVHCSISIESHDHESVGGQGKGSIGGKGIEGQGSGLHDRDWGFHAEFGCDVKKNSVHAGPPPPVGLLPPGVLLVRRG